MLLKLYRQHIFPHLLNQVMQVPSLMDTRREVLLPIQGRVLEIGFGTGVNLPFYQAVDEVVALEPHAAVFALAQQRIDAAPFHVKHIPASAEALPFPDHSFEHIVSTWTLCSIADLAQALKEIYRVLTPTGTFHLVEHVLHDHVATARLQHLLTPVQKKLADGCHLNRNIEQALVQAGFVLMQCDYFTAEGIPKIGQRMLMARAKRAEST